MRCLAALIREAARNGAGIIVLPEMCTTGLNIRNRAEAACLAESIPGPASDAFAGLARDTGAYLVPGLAESDRSTGRYYNSQIVIAPDGTIIGRYRKMHLFGPDLDWADAGNQGYLAVDTQLGRIGLGICCDINYWELMDFLAASRVDMLAFSTNWVGDEAPFRYWTDMVTGGGYYVIAANNWGDEGGIRYSGGSTILAPDMTPLARSCLTADCIIYADITPGRLSGSM